MIDDDAARFLRAACHTLAAFVADQVSLASRTVTPRTFEAFMLIVRIRRGRQIPRISLPASDRHRYCQTRLGG